MADQAATPYTGRTAWARNLGAPVRSFLSTETGSAAVLAAGALAALVWINVDAHSYTSVWTTNLSIQLGGGSVAIDLRHWVNEGLMTFFFLVVGLEAKREIDLGELREHRRLATPIVAALGGMIVPIAIYLAFNAGGRGAHGWGAAMSTDTALALGALALVYPQAPARLRVFLLTLAIFDDLGALIVIAVAYASDISVVALGVAVGLFVVLFALRYVPVARRQLGYLVGVALWVALFKSGIDPVIGGLLAGLITSAFPPSREDLERATALTRSFREQPTPELARSAQEGLLSAISPNERIQYALHPWTSYVIVPLFALANAGVVIRGHTLSDAAGSPITLGILVAYIVGKPLGVTVAAWISTRPALRGPRPFLAWPSLAAGSTIAGIAFTVSLLIASLAFTGTRLDQAKLGIIGSAILAPVVAWLCFHLVRRLPATLWARQISRTAAEILDLADEVDAERDHIRGPDDAVMTLVEYGDFECPYCGRAETAIRELLSKHGDEVRYVWRQLPLNDVHPWAQLAAEASEAADAQGKFWELHDLLLADQEHLTPRDLRRLAEELGLDVERFSDDLRTHAHAPRIAEDVASADASGVTGTPTFFINGRRHYGAYDIDTLSAAVQAARFRARALQRAAVA